MPRHIGTYKSDNDAPFELSRGTIENLVKCEACFWLEKVKGIKPPKPAGYNLNTNTDILLKRDFDAYKGIGPYPNIKGAGLTHLRPFQRENMKRSEPSPQFGVYLDGVSPNEREILDKTNYYSFCSLRISATMLLELGQSA